MKKKNRLQTDLNLLKIFDAIYAERHLTRAGNRMFMTQPAMSHALNRLRMIFEDELFVRTSKGLAPTAYAEKLAPMVAQGLHELRSVLDTTQSFDPTTSKQHFCISVEEYGALIVIPMLVQRVWPVAKGITIRARDIGNEPNDTKSGDRAIYNGLDFGEIDVAIMVSRRHPPRFRTELIYTEPVVCAVSAGNKQVGRRLDLETYLRLGHVKVYLDSDESYLATIVDRAFEKMGCKRNVVVTLPHFGAALSAVAKSDLVATVPLRVAKSLESIAGLRFLEPPLDVEPNSIFMVWHRRQDLAPASAWLRQMIRESCTVA